MEVRSNHTPTRAQTTGRGSGAGLRKRRRDAHEPRKDIIIRLEEELARQLKVVAACEGMTVQDFCTQALVPQIRKAMDKHGLSAEQIAR
jgi:predicted DNA binding CopG/RHH family protein